MQITEVISFMLGKHDFTIRDRNTGKASNYFETAETDLGPDSFKGLRCEWAFTVYRGPEHLPEKEKRQVEDEAKRLARQAFETGRLPFFVSLFPTVQLDNVRFWDTPAFFYHKTDNQPTKSSSLTPFFLGIKARVQQNTNLIQQLVPDETLPAKAWSFFGRAKELGKLVYGEGSVIVAGGRRIGKTSLLKEAHRRLLALGRPVVYIDFQSYDSPEEVIFELARKTGARDLWYEVRRGRGATEELLSACLRKLRRKGQTVTLLMDELGNVLANQPSGDWNFLGALRKQSQGGGFRFVFTCFQEAFLEQINNQGGPLVNAAETLRLAPFSEKEASDFVFSTIKYWATPTPDERRIIMNLIISRLGFHPYALVRFCSAVVERLVSPPRTRLLSVVNEILHGRLLETFERTFEEVFTKTKGALLKYVIVQRLSETATTGRPLATAVIDDDWLEATLLRAGYRSTIAGRVKIFAGLETHGFTARDRSIIDRQAITLPLLYYFLMEAHGTVGDLLSKLIKDIEMEQAVYDLKAIGNASIPSL
jgi:hypothetical protein